MQGEGIPLHGEFYTKAGGGLLAMLTRALGAYALTDLNSANRKMDRSLTLVTVRLTKVVLLLLLLNRTQDAAWKKIARKRKRARGVNGWHVRAGG